MTKPMEKGGNNFETFEGVKDPEAKGETQGQIQTMGLVI